MYILYVSNLSSLNVSCHTLNIVFKQQCSLPLTLNLGQYWLIYSKDDFHHCLNQGLVGSSETSWISWSRRTERTPPSQKPAQHGNQTGESGCQRWLILQKKTQQLSFPSFTNLNLLCCLLEQWICSIQPQKAESVWPQDIWLVSLVTTCFMCVTCRSHLYLMMQNHLLLGPCINVLKRSTPNPTHWFTPVEKISIAAMQSPQLQPKWSF